MKKNLGNACAIFRIAGLLLLSLLTDNTYATTISKANNTMALNLGSSWINGVAPGSSDIARWDSNVSGANTADLGTTTTWQGIAVVNPGGLVTVNGEHVLTLGAASTDIDMTVATADLTLNCPLALGADHVWDVAAGRTLTVAGAVTGESSITKRGSGTLLNGSSSSFSGSNPLSVDDGLFDLNGFDATFTTIQSGANAATIGNSGATATLTGAAQESVTINSLITGNLALRIANNHSSTTAIALNNANTFTGGLTLMNGTGDGTRLRISGLMSGTPYGSGPVTIGESSNDKAGILIDTVSNVVFPNAVLFKTDRGTDAPGIRFDTTGNLLPGQLTSYSADVDVTFSSKKDSAGTGGVTVTGKITGPGGLRLSPHYSSTTATLTVKLQSPPNLNDYAGDTTITRIGSSIYTLELGAENQIPNGSGRGNMVLSTDGCIFNLNGFSETINGLSGGGIVDNKTEGSPTLTIGDNHQTNTFDGVIKNTSGTLSLIKTGTGTQTLTGINLYSGATTILSGKLVGVVDGSAINSAITLSSTTATLGISVDDYSKSWTTAALTTAAAGTLEFNFTALPSTLVAPLQITGSTTFSAEPIVRITGNHFAEGTYPLITWDSVSGTPPTEVVLPLGVEGRLQVSGNTLNLEITSATTITPPLLTATSTNVTVILPGNPGDNYSLERATNVMFSAGVSNFPPVIAPSSGLVTNIDDFADLYGAPNIAIPPSAFYQMHNNEPMNVVLLLADDWRFDTLGVSGNTIVQTPRLDSLAAQGMRFTQACVTTPICGVSRACIYTGQWASRNGTQGFEMFDTPWSETYPGLLRANGYWVGHVGKWHNGTFPSSRYDFGRAYHGKHWYTVDGILTHVTDRNENDAMEFLRTRPTDKPFYLTVGFFAAHAEDRNPLQFLPQPEYTNLYENITIPVPVNATDESFYRLPPFLATETNEGRIRWHWRFDTPEKFQTMMKNYYRLCTGVDTACGRIMDELQAQGVLDNTLIIFIGDNGYYHAEHGLADKWYPHQESIRVPLIIRDPRMTTAGQTNDDIVLNVDLAPTILSATGIDTPTTMQGRDITPLYTGQTPEPAWRTEYYEEHWTIITSTGQIPASQALVRKDWKYMYWPDYNTEQLFDLINDPLEENDLVNDSTSQAKLIEMRQRFNELRSAAQ